MLHVPDFRVLPGRRIAPLLLALSTLLAACSDDTLKPSEVQGCYVLTGVMGTSGIMPLPATLDEAAGVSVVHAHFMLAPDRTYSASYTVRYREGDLMANATAFHLGSFRLHKNQVTMVDGEDNESTLTFDKALLRFTGSDLPPNGPWPQVLPSRVHVFDRHTCFVALH